MARGVLGKGIYPGTRRQHRVLQRMASDGLNEVFSDFLTRIGEGMVLVTLQTGL